MLSDIRLKPASAADVASGLLGFLSLRIAGRLVVDGLTLRRTRRGKLAVCFPSRRDRGGREHPYVRPLDDEARREIERAVFQALGLTEGA